MNQFLEKTRGRWQMILIISVSIAAIVFSISAFMTPKYQSDVSLLVIQKQPSSKVDAFSAAKSAEYLSDILARMVYTEAFMQDVLGSPIEINKELSSDPEERKEQWREMLEVRGVNNTGIIEASVFDPSREEAAKIAEAVGWALSVRGHNYHGGGERVVVKVIDGPITSTKPAQPNILLNTLVGFIVGLAIALAVVFFFSDLNLKIVDGKKEKSQKTIDKKLEEELKDDHPETLSEVDRMSKVDIPYEVISEKDKAIIEDAKKEVATEKAEEKEEAMKDIDKVSRVKKSSAAPDNLPTFSDEQEAPSASEIAHGYAPKREKSKEASEEEVKEKLNRLLKGDI